MRKILMRFLHFDRFDRFFGNSRVLLKISRLESHFLSGVCCLCSNCQKSCCLFTIQSSSKVHATMWHISRVCTFITFLYILAVPKVEPTKETRTSKCKSFELWIAVKKVLETVLLLVWPFQIVSFPNDPCQGSTGRNGTCYSP